MGKKKTNQRVHQKQTSGGNSGKGKSTKHSREHKFERLSQDLGQSLPGTMHVHEFNCHSDMFRRIFT